MILDAVFQTDPWPDMDYVEGYSYNFFLARRKKKRDAASKRKPHIQFIPERVVYERKF